MKFKSLVIPLAMVSLLSVGCGRNKNETTPNVTDSNKSETNKNDVTTSKEIILTQQMAAKSLNEVLKFKEHWKI